MQHPSLAGALPEGRTESLAKALPDTRFSLLELADRMLSRGVVLAGEATISVAGVDLIYLGLNVVLSAVETMQERATPVPQPLPPQGEKGSSGGSEQVRSTG
ncbi:MAG TPA: gas vesicle protein [Chloroflexota bacterium]|nr:gas vesicle protein [Chloroflexota bacterium]